MHSREMISTVIQWSKRKLQSSLSGGKVITRYFRARKRNSILVKFLAHLHWSRSHFVNYIACAVPGHWVKRSPSIRPRYWRFTSLDYIYIFISNYNPCYFRLVMPTNITLWFRALSLCIHQYANIFVPFRVLQDWCLSAYNINKKSLINRN